MASSRLLALLVSELRIVYGRVRTQVLHLLLALVPVFVAIAVKTSSSPPRAGQGPAFIEQIVGNGLFVAVTGLFIVTGFFLPLAVSVVAGETISGEASLGTLRYLLVVPAGRVRLLAVKAVTVVVFCVTATLTVVAAGVAIGAALFPAHAVVLLSGETVSFGAGLGRVVLVALYLSACVAALGVIGVGISTLTDTPVAAMASTVIIVIVSEIADTVPQVAFLRPYLLTHDWWSWADLLRQPVVADRLAHGLLTAVCYAAVAAAIAWARMTTRDVA